MSFVKICGLTRECDIDYVNKYRPDYIGFIFSTTPNRFRRQVSVKQAERLKKKLNDQIKVVGVFVNEPIEFIVDICNNNTVDVIQLHGEENEDYIIGLKSFINKPIIKAIKVQSTEQIIKAENLSCDYLLLDTYKKNSYGGTGEKFNWDIIPKNMEKPFFLAGGLTAENVALAISTVKPYCVDLSSSSETNGYKDELKIKRIIEEVRRIK